MKATLKNWLALGLVALLAGCGVGPAISSHLPTSPATLAASNYGEPLPSASELSRLEATSLDSLIDGAPAEPGVSVDGIGPQPPAEDLGNFGKVDPTLWRGARPTTKGLEKLAAMGVKTLVNFENDKKVVESERKWAEAHGIRFFSIPLSVITPPKMAKINEFLTLANDPGMRPMYIHCMQGRDRTGTAAFVYRLSVDHWTYAKAYEEMVKYKFHTYLLGLRGFLIWYAKTQAPAGTVGPVPANP